MPTKRCIPRRVRSDIGAALEASLLAFANCYPEETLSSEVKPVRRGSPKPLIDWGLSELLAVAKDKGWLPAKLSLDENFEEERAQIGDYAEVVRQIRNLVHPARHIQNLAGESLSLDHLALCFEVLQAATDWLLDRIGMDLRDALEKERENETG